MRHRIIGGLLLAALGAGCTGPTVPSPTTASATPGSPPPVASPSPTAPTEPFAELDGVTLTPPDALGPAWAELFALPYGDAPDQLGTSLGGEGVQWGPSYGAQLPDGSWWFLDVAHFRLAHYSETGEYLGEAPIPEQHLAGGEYVQYAMPLALADGTVVLQSSTPDDPAMLLLSPQGEFSRVRLPGFVSGNTTDGRLLYGFADDDSTVAVDPRTGETTPVGAFRDQNGASYAVEVAPGRLLVEREGVRLELPVAATGREASTVHLQIEPATGSDGVLNLLVNGFVEDTPGEITDASAFLRIDAAGRGLVEPLLPLSSLSDPGDGRRLGIRLGDHRPWLMVIGSDAVRVYRRSP